MASPASQAPRASTAPPSSRLAGRSHSWRGLSRLFVLWGEPEDGTRRVVGELRRDERGFLFGYGHDVDLAVSRGFPLLAEFPELRREADGYRSTHLFATF